MISLGDEVVIVSSAYDVPIGTPGFVVSCEVHHTVDPFIFQTMESLHYTVNFKNGVTKCVPEVSLEHKQDFLQFQKTKIEDAQRLIDDIEKYDRNEQPTPVDLDVEDYEIWQR